MLIIRRTKLYHTASGIIILRRRPSDAPLHRTDACRVWWCQMLCDKILTSWWWVQLCSKHVEMYNKLIIKQELVHYVVQLLRLYWDARSTKPQKIHAPGHPFKTTFTEFFLGVDFVICQYFCSWRHCFIVSYKNSEILYILSCKSKDCFMYQLLYAIWSMVSMQNKVA